MIPSNNETVGWMSSADNRGTADLMWSSCVTIFLCVWVSTYPNAPAPKDLWYHKLADKVNLAFIGLLGPDILLALAAGQLSSARRSVVKFNEMSAGSWSLTQGFYADMGGFHVVSCDYPEGFPVNAEQLYYLVRHRFVDMPSLTKRRIHDMSNFDPLSKIVTLWQLLWYTVTVMTRVQQGYSITTLELTTVTFAVVMLATSAFWFCKPQTPIITYLNTINMCSMASVREFARRRTHPQLPEQWYRTPLDFASSRDFIMDKHWAYYADLSLKAKLPLFHRATKIQWDRIPADVWYEVEGWLIPLALVVQIPFCIAFIAAWNFYFPSTTERLLWRAASVFHTAYSFIGTAYYFYRMAPDRSKTKIENKVEDDAARADLLTQSLRSMTGELQTGMQASDAAKPIKTGIRKSIEKKIQAWASRMRNLSPDGDPSMAMSLRWTISFFFPTVVYIFCRLYFYVEDFISLRSQPADVYSTAHSFLPFL